MGISGLLPFVKKACRKGSIQEFNGRTLAVDVSYLLHRGVFGCAGEIANGKSTDFYVRYVRKHVDILLRAGCHVILVFDGQPLPAKKEINDARRVTREKNSRLGHELTKQGLYSEAYRAFQQAVTITTEIVTTTIRAFKGVPLVDVIVAPYEADAQIAYLVQSGLAHAAVTEDSDLIVFGCERIVFKLDAAGGCLIYEKAKLANCVCPVISRRFEFDIFRRICILAGCDYLQGGLQGVGLKKAELFFTKTCQNDLNVILPKIPLYLNLSSTKVDRNFISEFIRAENTFLYQIVFDPINQRHTTLNSYPNEEADAGSESISALCKSRFNYAGEFATPFQAVRRALGNVDLAKSSALDEFVLPSNVPVWSVWSGEKFLRNRDSKMSQRKTSAFDKLGAFASKCSPRKVRRDLQLNRTFPVETELLIDTAHSLNEKAVRRIPLLDEDEGTAVKRISSSCDLNEDSGSEKSSRKRKCQRRSEPMEVRQKSDVIKSKSLVLHPQRNGSALSWNSTQWMKIYGADMSSTQPITSTQSEKFCLINTRNSSSDSIIKTTLATITTATSVVERSIKSPFIASSKLNPFVKQIGKAVGVLAMDESSNKLHDKESVDRADVSHLLQNLMESSPQTIQISQAPFQKSQDCRVNQSLTNSQHRVRRSLVELRATSTASQSSTSEDLSDNSQRSSSCASISTEAHGNATTDLLTTVSQEVFYRRRSSSSQQLSIQTKPKDMNVFVENKENILAAAKFDSNKNETTSESGARISPYFLNEGSKLSKLMPRSYRPSGLRRSTVFPRVL